MAEKTEKVTKDERVEIFIPRSGGDANYFVSLNGVNYLLPKGKTSKVPAYVAEEIKRAWKAADILEENKAALLANN